MSTMDAGQCALSSARVQGLLTGSQGLRLCCVTACVKGCICLCTVPAPPAPVTKALAASSAGKLLSFQPAATGQAFPWGKYLNKVCSGRQPRSVPSILQNSRTFLIRDHCMSVCIFICIHIFRYTHKYFTHYVAVDLLSDREF